MTKEQQSQGDLITEILTNSLDNPKDHMVYQKEVGQRGASELCFQDWMDSLIQAEGELCIQFPSAEGAHYIRYDPKFGFEAVYAGPHGPENRPADIDKANIKQLLEATHNPHLVPTSQSPFETPEATRSPQKM